MVLLQLEVPLELFQREGNTYICACMYVCMSVSVRVCMFVCMNVC